MGDLECMKIGRGHINGLQNPNVPTQEPIHYNFPNPGQATTMGANGRHPPNTQGMIKGLMQVNDPCKMGDLECMKIGRGHINGLQNPNVPT